jgi:hypothetical protein
MVIFIPFLQFKKQGLNPLAMLQEDNINSSDKKEVTLVIIVI